MDSGWTDGEQAGPMDSRMDRMESRQNQMEKADDARFDYLMEQLQRWIGVWFTIRSCLNKTDKEIMRDMDILRA